MADDNTNNNIPPIADESGVIKVWQFKQNADGSLTPASSGGVSAAVDISDTNGDSLLSNGAGALQVAVVSGGSAPTGTQTVTVAGTVTVAVTGTPTVEIAGIVGTSTVTVAGTVNTASSITGTATVTVIGTSTVEVAGIVGTSTVTIAGTVATASSITGTATVEVAGILGTSTVTVAGTVTVAATGTQTVVVAGTSTVEVAGIVGTSTVTVAGTVLTASSITGTATVEVAGILGTSTVTVAGTVTVAASGTQTVTVVGTSTVEVAGIVGTSTVTVAGTVLTASSITGTATVEVAGILGTSTVTVAGTVTVAATGTQTVTVAGTVITAAEGATGSPVPSDADYIGFNLSGNLVGVSASNPLPISGSFAAPTGTQTVTIAGSVSINSTPTVAIAGTSTVEVAGIIGTSTVTVAGTVTAACTGTQTVTVGGIVEVAPTSSANTSSNPFFNSLTDGTNGTVVVKPGIGTATVPPTFTTAGATNANPALTTTLSPNSGIPAIIQKTSGTGSGSQSSLTTSNFTNSVTAGNSIIVLVAQGLTNPSPTVTDTLGNSYAAGTVVDSANFTVYMYSATNIKGGANAVTVTPGSSTSLCIAAYEVSGVIGVGGTVSAGEFNSDQQGSIDAIISNNATSSSISTGAIGTLFPNEIAFAAVGIGVADQTINFYGPWRKDFELSVAGTPSGLFGLHVFSQPLGAPTSISFYGTITSEPWAALLVSLKPALLAVGGSVAPVGIYNSILPSLASSQSSVIQIDSSGRLLVGSVAGTSTVEVSGIVGTSTVAVAGGVAASITGTATVEVAGILGTSTVEVAGIVGTSTVTVAGTVTAACTGTQTVTVAGTSTVEVAGIVGTSTVAVAGTSTVVVAGSFTAETQTQTITASATLAVAASTRWNVMAINFKAICSNTVTKQAALWVTDAASGNVIWETQGPVVTPTNTLCLEHTLYPGVTSGTSYAILARGANTSVIILSMPELVLGAGYQINAAMIGAAGTATYTLCVDAIIE